MKKNMLGTLFLAGSAVGFLFVLVQPWFFLDIPLGLGSLTVKKLVLGFFEAALVGSLADWFAVTALFRRPLGLPLPHTDIIARRQDMIARAIPRFLVSFARPEALRAHLERTDLAAMTSRLLEKDEFRLTLKRFLDQRLASLPRFLASVRGEKIFQEFVAVLGDRVDFPGTAAGFLRALETSGLEQKVLDAGAEFLLGELEKNRPLLTDTLTALVRKNAGWQGLFVGKDTVGRMLDALAGELEALKADPAHRFRTLFKGTLQNYAGELARGGQAGKKMDRTMKDLLGRPEVQERLRDFLTSSLNSLAENREFLWTSAQEILDRTAEALVQDQELRQKYNQELTELVLEILARVQLAERLGDYLATLMMATDARVFAARIEEAVWNDLQYIRVNGAVVGGLAGLVLALVSAPFSP